MSTKKFVYSNEELRQLKPTKNNTSNEEDNTVKAIGSLTFETTYGYISAPLKERRKHEKLSNKHYNKKHKHKNKNYNKKKQQDPHKTTSETRNIMTQEGMEGMFGLPV